MLTTFAKNTLVPLLLRFALAAIFIFHGLDKVNGPDTQLGANWMKSKTGEPLPSAQPAAVQVAVAWGELIGGIALAFGFLTRLAAIGLIAIMVGAIATVHWSQGFSGFQYNFAIIVMCLCLVLGGPGPLSVDQFMRFFKRTAT